MEKESQESANGDVALMAVPTSLPSPVSAPSAKERLEEHEYDHEALLYDIDSVPPWYMCLFLGFQHYLEMLGSTVACPFILTPALCMDNDDPDKANIISTLVFMSGIITLLQCTLGTRLPIVQGGSFSYLVPSLAIMSLPQWRCPAEAERAGLSADEKTQLWQVRMCEIQGAIIVAASVQVLLAATGLVGFLVRYVTPLSVAPAITLIGLSLFRNVTEQCAKNYGVAFATVALLILCSQHLRKVQAPCPCTQGKKFPLFQVFPVLISVAMMWAICWVLTATDVLPAGDPARTDVKLKILEGAPWFRVPYPFQWGWPTVSLGAVAGMLSSVLTTTIESLGDYFACANISKAKIPPPHALNRGILVEGLGCALSGIWGSGNGSTSYSNNIGTIAVTRVASRRVIQCSGLIMIVLSLVGKAGAVFVSLPDPLLGGMFCYIFPLIMAVGIGTLAEVSLASERNLFIVSFSIFGGLAISQWAAEHRGVIHTGSPEGDNLIHVLLSTGMFMAGVIGFVLDNTIAGTPEERGLAGRQLAAQASLEERDTSYDLPALLMSAVRRYRWLRYLPLSPTYDGEALRQKLPFLNREK